MVVVGSLLKTGDLLIFFLLQLTKERERPWWNDPGLCLGMSRISFFYSFLFLIVFPWRRRSKMTRKEENTKNSWEVKRQFNDSSSTNCLSCFVCIHRRIWGARRHKLENKSSKGPPFSTTRAVRLLLFCISTATFFFVLFYLPDTDTHTTRRGERNNVNFQKAHKKDQEGEKEGATKKYSHHWAKGRRRRRRVLVFFNGLGKKLFRMLSNHHRETVTFFFLFCSLSRKSKPRGYFLYVARAKE